MKALSIATGILLAAANAPAQQLCGDLEITKTENGTLSSDPWDITALFMERCDTLSLEHAFFTVSYGDPDANNSLGLNWEWHLPEALDTTVDIVTNGWESPVTSVQLACTQREIERLASMHGSVSQYAFHVGGGGPRGRDARGSLCGSKVYRVFAPTQTTLEIPFHVSADIFAAESFGDTNATTGKVEIRFSGTANGVVIGPLLASVESTTVIPTQANVSQTVVVPVVVGPGATDVPLVFSGEVEVITRAQSAGLWGLLSGSATAGASFPNSVYVGNFRAAGGGPLPPCVSVVDATSGAQYAWTSGTAYCTAKTNSLGCVPAIESSGTPSASGSGSFVVTARNVLNQKQGMLVYGLNGRSAVPFQGGTLCVASPRRALLVSSGGNALPADDCSGVYSFDMNQFAVGALGGSPAPELTQVGTRVDCQWWGRDPGFAPPQNTTLSNALEYDVCL